MKSHYYLQRSFLALIGMFMLSAAFVYAAEESIVLTTYYPSPYGVYGEMRLYPKASATCNSQQEGLMYYDNNAGKHVLRVCGGSPLGWQDIGGGFWAASPSNSNNIYNTNSGNVGIGTTSPSTKLYIDFGNEIAVANSNGIALIGNNNPGIIAAKGAQELFTVGGVTSAGAYTTDSQPGDGAFVSAGRVLFGAGSVGNPPNAPTRMTITNNGNIGIGTTNPQAKLDIGGFGNGRSVLIGQSPGNDAGFVVSTGGFPSGKLGAVFVHSLPTFNGLILASYQGGPIRFWTTTTDTGAGFLERVTILNNGNVGIGTTSPQAKLHVLAPGVDGIMLQGGIGWGDASLSKVSSSLAPDQGGSIELGAIIAGDARLASINPVSGGVPYIDMHYGNGLAEDYNVRIINNGNNMLTLQTKSAGYVLTVNGSNVGIGTTNPASKFEVNGDMRISSWGNFILDGTNRWIMHTPDDGRTQLYLAPWIGTDWAWGNSYEFLNTGVAWSNGWSTRSDQRLKESIENLTDVVKRLKNIRGVTFYWKTQEVPDFPKRKQIGVIAQEVEREFPELVSTDERGYKAVDYGKLTPVLLQAIKEQQKQIEELRVEDGALRGRIEALEKK